MLYKPGYEAWLDPKDTVWMGPNLELTRHHISSPLSLGLQSTFKFLCQIFMSCFKNFLSELKFSSRSQLLPVLAGRGKTKLGKKELPQLGIAIRARRRIAASSS